MAQVQCPNCGGYRVNEERVHTDPKTNRNVSESGGCGDWIRAFVAGVAAFFVIGGCIGGELFGVKTTDASYGTWVYATLFLSVALGIAALVITRRARRAALARADTTYNYYCLLCGYRWSWRPGTPLPNVQVRPELIAKGEQKLAEEAAA